MHNPSPWADTPTPGSETRHTPSTFPPHFQNDGRSPVTNSGPLHRNVSSGGLRGLLNDDGPERRRSSGRESFSSAGYEEPGPPLPRSRINHLVYESAPPLSQSSSHSSMGQSAYSHHSHQSPVSKPYSLLDHDGFLAPATPASAYPRASRSPYSLNSPSGYSHAPLPNMNMDPSNTRSPYPHSHDQLPLRSPSISMSPRQHYESLSSHHQPLPPYPSHSRPGSSSSASGFSFHAPHESPSIYQRQMSVDYASRPRSGSRTTGPSSRRPSTGTAYQPPPTKATRRSPSPPPRLPYAPHQRISQPMSLLTPIHREEIEQYKAAGLSNNPLRTANHRPPPSWSGPSPSPGLHRMSGPQEVDASYFNNSNSSRRGTTNSPGPSAPKKRKKSDRYSAGELDPKGSNGTGDARRKLEDKRYMGNVGLVADHCEYPPSFDLEWVQRLTCVRQFSSRGR